MHPHPRPAIPDEAFLPAAFAKGDAPTGAAIAGRIEPVVLAPDWQHEAPLEAEEQTQPEGRGIAPVARRG